MNKKRDLRKNRTRSTIRKGETDKLRLSVFRSNKYIHAQVINDAERKTLVAATSKEVKKGTKIDKAKEVGKIIAEKAKKEGINDVVFDRREYKYHGRVKALADGAREGGLKF
ncbi:MAG: 50S ribosomal protein L18 [Candidatus Paceibacterota bacterium]